MSNHLLHNEKGLTLIEIALGAAIALISIYGLMVLWKNFSVWNQHVQVQNDLSSLRNIVAQGASCEESIRAAGLTAQSSECSTDINSRSSVPLEMRTPAGDLLFPRAPASGRFGAWDYKASCFTRVLPHSKTPCLVVDVSLPKAASTTGALLLTVPICCDGSTVGVSTPPTPTPLPPPPPVQLPSAITCKYEIATEINYAYGYFSASATTLYWHQWRTTDPAYDKAGGQNGGRLWFEKEGRQIRLGDAIPEDDASGWTLKWFIPADQLVNVYDNIMDTQVPLNLPAFINNPSAAINNSFAFGNTGYWPTRMRDCTFTFNDVRSWPKPDWNRFNSSGY